MLAGRSRALDQGFISLYGWGKATYIGRWADLYEAVAAESCPLFGVLRYLTPSSPIYLFEETHKPFALSRVFLFYSAEKKASFS